MSAFPAGKPISESGFFTPQWRFFLLDLYNAAGGPSGSVLASSITFLPYGGILATNVQAAIDDLEDRKATVVSLVSLSTSSSTGIGSLSTGLSTTSSGLTSLSTSTSTGLSTATSGIASLSTSTSTGISSLSTGLSTTNSSLTSLSTSTSTGLSTATSSIVSLSSSTSTGVGSLSTGLSTTNSGLVSLSTSTSTGLSTHTSQITSLSTGLSTTNSTVTTLSTSASTGLSTHTSQITSLSTGLSTTNSSVVSLSTSASTGIVGRQPLDSTLTALAGANWATDSLAVGTGADTVGQIALAANQFVAKSSAGAAVAKSIVDAALALMAGTATSANLATLLSDELGSGFLPFTAVAAWTPVLTAATPGDLNVVYAASGQVGYRVRIGNFVVAFFNIVTSTFTWTTASGNMRITGVGVTADANIAAYFGAFGDFRGITKASYTQFAPTLAASGNAIEMRASGSGQVPASLAVSDFPTGGTVNLRGFLIFNV